MTVLNNLKNIFSSTPGDEKPSTRELVRKQLQRTDNLRDFHLENVTETDITDKKEPQYESKSSEVHKNFVYAEQRLASLLDDDETKK